MNAKLLFQILSPRVAGTLGGSVGGKVLRDLVLSRGWLLLLDKVHLIYFYFAHLKRCRCERVASHCNCLSSPVGHLSAVCNIFLLDLRLDQDALHILIYLQVNNVVQGVFNLWHTDCCYPWLVLFLWLLADGIALDAKALLSAFSRFLWVKNCLYFEILILKARALLVSECLLRPFQVMSFVHWVSCALDPIGLAICVYLLHWLFDLELLFVSHREAKPISLSSFSLGFKRGPFGNLRLNSALDRNETIQIKRLWKQVWVSKVEAWRPVLGKPEVRAVERTIWRQMLSGKRKQIWITCEHFSSWGYFACKALKPCSLVLWKNIVSPHI